MKENEINEMVIILAISKMIENETLKDVIFQMENAGAFSPKESKQLITKLKNDKIIIGNELSFIGLQKAKEAKAFFSI